MRRLLAAVAMICILLTGCYAESHNAQIVATTLPVFEFTSALCKDTNISVAQLVTENVSCLHDYTLQVHQMQMLEDAQIIVTSGAGLDAFITDVLPDKTLCVDASKDVTLLCADAHHDHNHDHHGDADPHIWLSPLNAKTMADNIYNALLASYPEYKTTFAENLAQLHSELDALYSYGNQELEILSSRNCITFHDGFAYLADVFDLHILEAIEEESGSEASAQEIIELISLIGAHNITAIFTERNGTASSADILHNETGTPVYVLDMAMSGDSYFDAMYHNIRTLKEALK